MFRHCDEIHLLAYSPSVSPLIAIRKLFPLAFRSGIPNSEAVENSDEKLGLCGLCGGLVQWRECAAGCVAAVSGACANADMAWDSARFAALHEAGDRSDGDEGSGRRKTVDLYQQCLAADADGLLANGEEHGRGGNRVPGRRIRNPRHRSRGHRGLRLACIPRHYLRAPEIPSSRAAIRSLLGGISAISDSPGRCPKDDQSGSLSRRRMAHRSAQNRSSWIFGGRTPRCRDECPFRSTHLSPG